MTRSFKKEERLSLKRDIDNLFKTKNKKLNESPFIVYFLPNNLQNHRVLISVTKRKFKKAVDRNLLKRRIREAYRLNKVNQSPVIFFDIAFIYISNEILAFDIIEKAVIEILRKINSKEL